MQKRGIFVLQVISFVFTMAMLVLFSTGTMLMTLPKVENKVGGAVQFSTSGGPDVVIEKFEFKNSKVKPKDDLPLDVDIKLVRNTADGPVEDDKYAVTGIELYAYNLETFEKYEGSTQRPDGIIKPRTWNSAGTYKISSITVVTRRLSDNNIAFHYITASNCTSQAECENYKYLQKTFTLEDPATSVNVPIYEYTIGFDKTDPEVYVGDKIDINLRRIDKFEEVNMQRKEIKTMMLSFTNEDDGNVVNVYVKDLFVKPNMVVPSTATPGKYHLNFGYLTFVDNTSAKYQNTDTKTFSYNSTFIVKSKEEDTTKYEFNNVAYGKPIADKIAKLDDDAVITIDANTLPVINEEVFNSIKGTKRTLIIEYETSRWVFSGTDIENSKSIDVKTMFTKLTTDSEYYDEFLKENVTGNSALLQFADNGDLPGKVLIKIDRASVDVALNNPGQIYVYYYKEDSDKLVKVAMEIQSNDTFYEFYINHNSKYVLTTEEISEKVVEEDLDMLSLNHQIVVQQQQQIPMIYVIATICGGIAIILLFVVLGKKKQAQQQQTQE